MQQYLAAATNPNAGDNDATLLAAAAARAGAFQRGDAVVVLNGDLANTTGVVSEVRVALTC